MSKQHENIKLCSTYIQSHLQLAQDHLINHNSKVALAELKKARQSLEKMKCHLKNS